MEKQIKLNIGSGKRFYGDDWDHIDGAHYDHIKSHDVSILPYEDNSVGYIFSSHLVAYFSREEIVPILNEWRRVLKPGGILRLATPDFDAIGRLIMLSGYSLSSFIGPLYGKMLMGDKEIYHKTTWNFNDISYLLYKIGFNNVKKYNWQDTEHAHIDDHSRAHYPGNPESIKTGNFSNQTLISLNVECIK